MTTNRPHVHKVGTWWRVYINDRMWSSTPTFTEAIERAHGIASYAQRIRFQRDLTRMHASLQRIKENR